MHEFPNVSVIDLSAIIAQFQRITDQVSRAVQFVFLFAIAAGFVVLFAAITSTQDERVFEGAILRTLGASRGSSRLLQLAEFLTIGLLAGTIASAGAVALSMVLSDRVLGVPYEFHWQPAARGIVIGGVGVAIAGLIGTRRVVSTPPLADAAGRRVTVLQPTHRVSGTDAARCGVRCAAALRRCAARGAARAAARRRR